MEEEMAKMLLVFKDQDHLLHQQHFCHSPNQLVRIKAQWNGSPWEERERPSQRGKAHLGRVLTVRGDNQWRAAGHNEVCVCKQTIDHSTDRAALAWTCLKDTLVTQRAFIEVRHWMTHRGSCPHLAWRYNGASWNLTLFFSPHGCPGGVWESNKRKPSKVGWRVVLRIF